MSAAVPNGYSILCVDDEETGLYFRKLILEGNGYKVLTATNPTDALNLFRNNAIDLVVTDHLLGRSTGTKMAAEMRRIRPEVPIIVLSGTTDLPQDVNLVANAFISKTDGPEQLLERIAALLTPPAQSSSGEDTSAQTADSGTTHIQALLAAIVESSDDAIFSKTLDGRIMSWNRAAERIYGYQPDEIIGRSVTMLLPPDRPNEVNEIMRRIKAGERLDHFETARLTKDGRTLQVSLTISPIHDRDGNIAGASTIARDVTRVKMAEEAVRSSERLAVAGRLAATVAHEINNPLDAVTNILYVLASSTSLPERDREFVQTAQEEIKRIRQITKLTLGFHREDDSRQESVDMAELVDGILSLYGRKIQSLGIKVERRFRSAGTVQANRGELRQVFTNLIINAVDAMAETGDRLRIHIMESHDFRDPGIHGVRVIVSDNGAGIPPLARGRLFEPFFSTKGSKGTGIGLWVSRSLIAKHGGTIKVRSSVSPRPSGTAFSVFVPFNFAARGRQAEAA